MSRLGIMQGRLSPPVEGRIQAFPVDSWREEFETASDCGFRLIEWVVDAESFAENPIFSADGRSEIRQLCQRYGISIPAICL